MSALQGAVVGGAHAGNGMRSAQSGAQSDVQSVFKWTLSIFQVKGKFLHTCCHCFHFTPSKLWKILRHACGTCTRCQTVELIKSCTASTAVLSTHVVRSRNKKSLQFLWWERWEVWLWYKSKINFIFLRFKSQRPFL